MVGTGLDVNGLFDLRLVSLHACARIRWQRSCVKGGAREAKDGHHDHQVVKHEAKAGHGTILGIMPETDTRLIGSKCRRSPLFFPR
jgi:hypothetical protein